MFKSPEDRGFGEEMDLDFTKKGALEGIEVQEDHASIEDKILELKNSIASAERGIELAKKLGDSERTAQMVAKKQEFEETLNMLTSKEKSATQEFWVEPATTQSDTEAFDAAHRAFGEYQAADKRDAAEKRYRDRQV